MSAAKPQFVYVTYIATTPEKVWEALTEAAFTRQYFSGFAIEVEPKAGGAFPLRPAAPAGRRSCPASRACRKPASRCPSKWNRRRV
jgi:uncharacterized protein YndB with AHSA1/START domain